MQSIGTELFMLIWQNQHPVSLIFVIAYLLFSWLYKFTPWLCLFVPIWFLQPSPLEKYIILSGVVLSDEKAEQF